MVGISGALHYGRPLPIRKTLRSPSLWRTLMLPKRPGQIPRAPKTSDGACRVWPSSPGRPPKNDGAAKKALPGNSRGAPQRRHLGQHRRPPRSFSQGTSLQQFQHRCPLRKWPSGGARRALPEAGAVSRGPGPRPLTAAATGTAIASAPHQLCFSPGKSSKLGRSPRSSPDRIISMTLA